MGKGKHILYEITIILFVISCSSKKEKTKYDKIFLSKNKKTFTHWDNIFGNERTISLDTNIVYKKLFLSKLKIGDNNIITRSYNKHIVFFDSLGHFIRTVGGKGRGPGEFLRIGPLTLDDNQNLWVYDPALKRLTFFNSPNYKLGGSIALNAYISDFVIDENKNIVAYTPLRKNIITIFNNKGKVIFKKFKSKNKKLRIFLSRYQQGGISKNKKGFYAIFPEEYAIRGYHYQNREYELANVIKSQKNTENKFRPVPPVFPEKLNPHKSHLAYWRSFLHVLTIYNTSKIIVIPLYKNISRKKYKFYLNIYSKKGNVITEGVSIPHNAMVVDINKKKIYTVTKERMTESNKILPQKLRVYTFKQNVINY